jgi:hypothetical protein
MPMVYKGIYRFIDSNSSTRIILDNKKFFIPCYNFFNLLNIIFVHNIVIVSIRELGFFHFAFDQFIQIS